MKKVVGLFITVIIMFCQALTAASENVIQYNPIMPECSFITTGDPIRANMLMSTEYVSADEIWFSGTADEGGPCIAVLNTEGQLQSAVRIEAEAQYINKPYIISEKSMIILGTAGEILIKKLEF